MRWSDIPAKPGYAINRSNFGYGRCSRCDHDDQKHFWWHALYIDDSTDKVGCLECYNQECQDRKEQSKMSAVNLCERCDSLMLGKAVGTIDVFKGGSNSNEHIELCPDCIGDFVDFLATRPVRERKTYRDPWAPPAARTESQLMLERGYCGAKYSGDGEGLCLRARDHEGSHRDGSLEWS